MNLVGGQDELVFDGGSLVMDATGAVVTRAPQFAEAAVRRPIWRFPHAPGSTRPGGVAAPRVRVSAPAPPAPVVVAPTAPSLSAEREVYEALVLGTRDYVTKNGFGDVVVGLSGGIDSSLVATIAVDALGPERVHGVLMPSRYSSDHSITDAEALATNLGIDHRTIAIEPAHRAFTDMLAPSFAGRPAGSDRGEPAVAHARRDAHGAVQQAGLVGAHHRQQERERGRATAPSTATPPAGSR